MSAISFAKSAANAFRSEKPHSSITNWVDILTSINYDEEAYDGIPELVDSINLQGLGPTEASRAIRKKVKHGDAHHQYRALVILKALVENCGHKFQTTFADGYLTDALKNLASDPSTDAKVKTKLFAVLASWNAQFKSDPSMSLVANLYKQCRPSTQRDRAFPDSALDNDFERKRAQKEEVKKRAKKEKEEAKEAERARKEEEATRERERTKNMHKGKRPPFNFEKEKPQVLTCIANSSQASSNLVNAITLVNQETDSLSANERVQECLLNATQARKPIIRYIQLVENEELIGTLIETNERIIAAMEMYDKLTAARPGSTQEVSNAVQAGLTAAHISIPESQVNKLQERQRAAVERAKRSSEKEHDDGGHIHPDLQDLSFGPLGSDQRNLPPPLRPSAPGNPTSEPDSWQRRGSLSDFSDYESSDESARNAAAAGSSRRYYVDVSDDPDDDNYHVHPKVGGGKLVDVEDPFADPFA
jgi:hypothetical protein